MNNYGQITSNQNLNLKSIKILFYSHKFLFPLKENKIKKKKLNNF
jgi:hypothetical protein